MWEVCRPPRVTLLGRHLVRLEKRGKSCNCSFWDPAKRRTPVLRSWNMLEIPRRLKCFRISFKMLLCLDIIIMQRGRFAEHHQVWEGALKCPGVWVGMLHITVQHSHFAASFYTYIQYTCLPILVIPIPYTMSLHVRLWPVFYTS
jgi:hypothetical protein